MQNGGGSYKRPPLRNRPRPEFLFTLTSNSSTANFRCLLNLANSWLLHFCNLGPDHSKSPTYVFRLVDCEWACNHAISEVQFRIYYRRGWQDDEGLKTPLDCRWRSSSISLSYGRHIVHIFCMMSIAGPTVCCFKLVSAVFFVKAVWHSASDWLLTWQMIETQKTWLPVIVTTWQWPTMTYSRCRSWAYGGLCARSVLVISKT